MHKGYRLAVLFVALPLLAYGGSGPTIKPSPETGERDHGLPGSSSSKSTKSEEAGDTVAYVIADNLLILPDPSATFPDNRENDSGSGPTPAYIWHQEDGTTTCFQASTTEALFCYHALPVADAAIGAKGALLKKLFRKLFESFSSTPGRKRGTGEKSEGTHTAPPAPTASGARHLLGKIEAWRKPMLTPDKRIHPYRKTRNSASPIPNLGLNRAGKTISDGKHTISFDSNGFPRFNTKFETLLDDTHIGTGNRQAHIKAANTSLSKTIQKDAGLAKDLGLNADDIAALTRSHQAPTGYRWHHHQDAGRMQLVKFEEHRLATPHTGGMAIWGGDYP